MKSFFSRSLSSTEELALRFNSGSGPKRKHKPLHYKGHKMKQNPAKNRTAAASVSPTKIILDSYYLYDVFKTYINVIKPGVSPDVVFGELDSLLQLGSSNLHNELVDYLFLNIEIGGGDGDGESTLGPNLKSQIITAGNQLKSHMNIAVYPNYIPSSSTTRTRIHHIPIILLITLLQNSHLYSNILRDVNLLFGYNLMYAIYGYIYEFTLGETQDESLVKNKTGALLFANIHQLYTQFNTHRSHWSGREFGMSLLVTEKYSTPNRTPVAGTAQELIKHIDISNSSLNWAQIYNIPRILGNSNTQPPSIGSNSFGDFIGRLNDNLIQQRDSHIRTAFNFGTEPYYVPWQLREVNNSIMQVSGGLNNFRFFEILGQNPMNRLEVDCIRTVKQYAEYSRDMIFPHIHSQMMGILGNQTSNFMDEIRGEKMQSYLNSTSQIGGTGELIF